MNVRKYKIGFSLIGLIAFTIPMIPNIFWALLPPVVENISDNKAAIPIVDIIQMMSQIIMIALLITLINKEHKSTPSKKWIGGIALICLIGYFASWIIYYTFEITPLLLLGMAILPSIYFICVGLYLDNYPALIPAVVFASIHIVTTAQNYL